MLKPLYLFIIFLFPICTQSQSNIEWVDELEIDAIEPYTKKTCWLKMIENGMSQPVYIPVIIVRGKEKQPVLGLAAAIHGNELNGIKVIQEVIDELDLSTFNGTLIAIPGLNTISITEHKRRYFDEEDLNRKFPGKENGNRSQQYVWQINQKVLSKLDYLVDMHTASFGRENTLYVRAKLEDKQIEKMANLQDADIILNSNGSPSANKQAGATRTMRAEAMLKGIPTITIEYGNPQVFQTQMVERGKRGIHNILSWLKMTDNEIELSTKPVLCKKSYWMYVKEGGYLDIKVELNQVLQQGELIAIMRDPFGNILNQYFCPEDGIVIGKSSNPVNMSGGRIIHLGIMDN